MPALQPSLFGAGLVRHAELSGGTDGEPVYRYALWRTWAPERGVVLWVLFNPSTADAERDDPTIRRVMGFTQAWGYGACEVVNLYALRSTQPWRVLDHPDPVGPANDRAIVAGVAGAARVLAGWGATIGPGHTARVDAIARAVAACGATLECLGQTYHGHPRHPLYLRADTVPMPFRRRA